MVFNCTSFATANLDCSIWEGLNAAIAPEVEPSGGFVFGRWADTVIPGLTFRHSRPNRESPR